MPTRSPNREYGFTLIELLVVISIIAILASLLLPGLSRAKATANSVKCKSNLHQMGIGLTLYVADFGVYPRGSFGMVEVTRSWQASLREYCGEPGRWRSDNGYIVFEKTGIFRCPGVRRFRGSNLNWTEGVSYENYGFNEHYGYNEFGSTLWGSIDGLAGDEPGVNDQTKRLTQAVREERVKVPSDMVALGDGLFGFGSKLPEFIGRLSALGRDYYGLGIPDPKEETKRSRQRHNDRSNVVFCDGHVEGIRLDTLYRDTSDRALRRWNRDHEAHRRPRQPSN